MKRAGEAWCAAKKAFLRKGWVPTEKGLWRRVNSTEAYVNIYPNGTGEGETIYEFSIMDPKGIDWQSSRKLFEELEDLLPVEASVETVMEPLDGVHRM